MDYAELQEKVLKQIEDKKDSIFNQDQMKLVVGTIDDRIKELFNQKETGSVQSQFEQLTVIQGMKTSDLVVTALGASVSGAVGGILGSIVPAGISIGGVNAILAGVLARKFIAKKGMPAKFAEGVVIGGISTALAGLGLSGQVSGLFGGLRGGNNGVTAPKVSTGDTTQTMALRGETSSSIPAGFTE